MTLIIARGLPGSGKTTFAKFVQTLNPNVKAVAADDFMVDEHGNYKFDANRLTYCHKRCLEETTALLLCGHHVVVHNTFTRNWEFSDYVNVAKKLNVPYFVVIIENMHGNQSVHNVPLTKLHQMAARFEINL